MPGLQFIKILGNLKFFSHGLKLPVSWQAPSGSDGSKQYGDSIKPDEKVAMPQLIPPWFMPAEPQKYFVDSCDKIGKEFKDFHDTMLDAIGFAHNMWKLQAKFQNLQVMAVVAIGTPGCLDGPELESLIKNAPMCATFTGNKAKYRDAVAAGVSKCFKDWQGQVMVPGLPWYPAFAAFPGPMAPPMPNIPMPLIACPSAQMARIIVPSQLADEMKNALDGGMQRDDKDKQYEALFDAIATVLALAFLMWMPMQQVMLVMGKGPIPTFAPPFVPVGPVLGGDNIAVPGHLMT
ncbi:MAG: hypothetical protein JWN44_4228 [Myxococcales bacterium]|nr:hypothetical protein [Myxococcales bacterium]